MTETESLLMAYVDGELDAAAAAGVERLLADDAHARRSVEIYRHTAALLRAACAEGVYAAARPARPSTVARLPRRWLTLAIAASVTALVAGYAAGARGVPDDFLADVAEYHRFYSRETIHLAEVPAERADEIARWLGGHLGLVLTAPDLSAQGLRFAGGRMLVSDGHPVADLLYTRADGLPVALCIRGGGRAARELTVTTRDGLRLASWDAGGYSFAVVGEMSAVEARTLAARAASQLGV